MPAPGEMSPARIEKSSRDLVWEYIYAPVARGIDVAAAVLNRLQFLTILRYLGFVFLALVGLLVTLALWQ
jgi:hypothetical protein